MHKARIYQVAIKIFAPSVAHKPEIMHDPCMDSFDLRILAALQRDGVSPTTNWPNRLACQLRNARVVASSSKPRARSAYHVLSSPRPWGLHVHAFVQVTLATHSPDNARRFQRLVEGLEEVLEAFAVTGEADYLIRVIVPDLPSLARILNEVFLPHESVAHVRSFHCLDLPKGQPCAPRFRPAGARLLCLCTPMACGPLCFRCRRAVAQPCPSP